VQLHISATLTPEKAPKESAELGSWWTRGTMLYVALLLNSFISIDVDRFLVQNSLTC
jgi:hypothetical protein